MIEVWYFFNLNIFFLNDKFLKFLNLINLREIFNYENLIIFDIVKIYEEF